MQLAAATREQNAKLRDAYREIEENNKALDSALKKVQAVRMAATVFVVILFLGAAWYVWDVRGSALREDIAETPGARPGAAGPAATTTVAPRRLTVTLSFVGQLAPGRRKCG